MRLPAAAVAVALMVLGTPLVAAAVPPDGLAMVSETSVVTGSGSFTTDLALTGPVPSGEELSVTGYERLTSRTGFSRAVAGHPGAAIYHGPTSPVSSLLGTDGDVVVTIPVDPTSAGPGPFPGFNARSGSSVYPVTFQLDTPDGVPDGSAVTGFLVYSTGPDPGLPPLAVAVAVAVTGPADPGPTVTRLPVGQSASVAALTSVLVAHPRVPVTLDVDPDLVARLGAGDATDRQSVGQLASAVASGDELLAAPYFPTDPGALAAAGLAATASTEWSEGDATLQRALGRQPTTATAVIDGPTDPAELTAEASLGADRFVLPDADLTPLAASEEAHTYARPEVLTGRGVPALPVVALDPELSGLLVAGGDAALDAHDVLAGLAYLQLDSPATVRGVAIEAPAGDALDPAVLSDVLAGLQGNPFVTPVTADGLFGAVPSASSPPQRSPVDTKSPAALPGAASLRAAALAVQGLSSLLPDSSKTVAPLDRDLLSAASEAVTTAQRAALAGAVVGTVDKAEAGISLPGSTSITLTSRQGNIPLTILSNRALVVHVELRVSAPKLRFLPFDAGAGPCTATEQGEACPLVLTAEATTVRVPVESRTSGVFGLAVTLTSPDGAVQLATDRDTVRSTAISGVGLILIVVAGLGLIGWWIRNARHGRRARQLVDPPTGETPAVPLDPPAGPGGSGEGGWVDDDPVVAEFFASPPPEWEPASPSGPHRGPTP